MMCEYNSEYFEDEGEYRPGTGVDPTPVHHGPMLWHGHGGYYRNKYYNDINYFYYIRSCYHLYSPYDPYFDYYNNTY